MRYQDFVSKFKPQKLSLLNAGKISNYISVREFADSKTGKLPYFPDTLDGALQVQIFIAIELLLDTFDFIRSKYGKAIQITSGWREITTQEAIKTEKQKQGKSEQVAKSVSPHIFGVALDIKDPSLGSDQSKLLQFILSLDSIGKDLRIGSKSYNLNFLHIDVAYALPIDSLWQAKFGITTKEAYEAVKASWRKGVRW
ncbi:MAG: hypothetical protein QXY76_03215 [Nitrososphaeria archaeon]